MKVFSIRILPEACQLIDNAFYYAETNFGETAVQRWEKELQNSLSNQ